MKRIYLDHNATTPLDARVLDAMLPYLRGCFGNPSSIHEDGIAARQAIEGARERVARRFGVSPSEIHFTSGGTEGNNLIIASAAGRDRPGHVITTAIEHASILATCRALEERGLIELTVVPVDTLGRVNPAAIARAIRPRTTLVSVMAANNETGVLQPTRAVGGIAHAHGIPFHCDATQLCGKGLVVPAAWLADYVTCSAHKFYGPKGAGVLYRRSQASFSPSLFGGYQEHGLRPGTENVAAIVGLAEALDLAHDPVEWEHARVLRCRLREGLARTVPDLLLNTPIDHAVGNTLNISFLGVSSASLLLALDLRGVSVSTGAACHTTTRAPSAVLLAMGRTPAEARSAVRFSVGRSTTDEDIDATVSHVSACVARLRATAPATTEASARDASEAIAS